MRKKLVRFVIVIAWGAAFQAASGASGSAAELPGWKQLVYCRKAEGNLTFQARWYPQQGIRFLVRERITGATAIVSMNEEEFQVRLRLPERDGAQREMPVRFNRDNVLRQARRKPDFVVKFREDEWLVYQNGALAAIAPAPFQPPADIYWPDETPARIEGKARFRPVPREEFMSDFMIEEGAPNQLYPWKVQSGKWRIHTAMQDALVRPESNVDRIKKVPLTPDKSPNFYSLKGEGEGAVITTGYDFFDDYEFSASMQTNDGEVGLVFYHRDQDNYYAFTYEIRPQPERGGILKLWRVRQGQITILARAKTDLFLHQWYLPKIRAHTDEIVCFLDGIEVMRVKEELPVGGKVGLYATTSEETRFDDVKLHAFRKLPLEDVRDIRFQTLRQQGRFYRAASFWRTATPDSDTRLRPKPTREAQYLAVGRRHHRNTVFSAVFDVRAPVYEIGLLCGYRSADRPYYRFTVHRSLNVENYRLYRIRRGGEQLLESWTLEEAGGAGTAPVKLMVDASGPGRLRLLKDDKLVIVASVADPLRGGAGLYLGPNTEAEVHSLQYAFERELNLEQQNKNPVFQKDSFMRHWAAPEGQWLGGEGGELWHKGDFFGDFTIELPCIAGSELQIGIRNGETQGPVAVTVDENGMLALTVRTGLDAEGTRYEHQLPTPEGATFASLNYELHHEGYWLWVDVEGKTVIKHRMAFELAGTRAKVKGMELTHMARSKVTRTNVIDDYFTASPYNWTINGGNWQIINRFQCTPSWSHMVGESKDSLAALWYKAIFTGDLTLEFYAGTRHGWYERAGDLNCTIMADEASPDAGYTITCTEWDYNLSQNWSTLYRNGKPVDRSDKYLVPRRRKGMVRKFLNPLIAAGRPIHGAWYYIKLRKAGNRVEYYFDNEKIFSFEDPDVLRKGLIGIWTFMQSMTVAQVKITFTNVRPRPFRVEQLPLREPSPPEQEEKPETEKTGEPPSVGGYPFDPLKPAYWTLEDPVGQSRLGVSTMNASVLTVRNRLGAGNLLLTPDLPALPLAKLAGWRLLIKRTPGALFNIHYSTGKTNAKGEYIPTKRYFHHISGTTFSEGEFQRTGESSVPPCESFDSPGSGWRPVHVWIPSRIRSPDDAKKGIMVRLEGIGNMQPNTVMAGIGGNRPGVAYAIRQLTPVFYGVPALTVTADGKDQAITFVLRDRKRGSLLCETSDPREVQDALKAATVDGRNQAWLGILGPGAFERFHELAWIRLPETIPIRFAWHPAEDGAVLLDSTGGYPDPRFAAARITFAGKPLALEPGNDETRIGRAPEGTFPELDEQPGFAFGVDPGTGPEEMLLKESDRVVNSGPALISLDGLTPFLHTFEGSDKGKLRFTNDGRMAIRYNDPVQGRFLQVRNTAAEQRLSASFGQGLSVAQYPLLQFRYRAFDMVHLSIGYSNSHYVRLGDDYASAAKVRLAHDLKLDETWHSWTGFVPDAFTTTAFDPARFTPKAFTLASAGSPDQTGRYSKWCVDDIVYGPAVAKSDQLAFTPSFRDEDGIEAVFSSVLDGKTPYAELDETAVLEIDWDSHQPGTRIVPSVEGLKEGTHHVLVKALDTVGNESAVTDIPFLLDTTPMEVTHSFGAYSDPASNGTQLSITFKTHSQAPWAIGKAKFLVAGKAAAIPAWTSQFRHQPGSDRLILNYPFIFRSYLDGASNGDSFEFAIDNIVDGAGNPTPKLVVPITVDHSKDKTGPAWYVFYCGDSVHWFWNWDGCRNKSVVFSAGRYNTISVVHTQGNSPFIQTQTYRSAGDLSRAVQWKPATHPWLSFRLCLPVRNKATKLHVILTTAAKKSYSISLTTPSKARTELNRTRTFTWRNNKWQRFSFNVKDMLKAAGVTDAAIAGMTITKVNFTRRGAQHKESLYLDDFFIHGPARDPGKPDLFKWRAYDASGVASLEIASVDAGDKILWTRSVTDTDLDLNTLRPKIGKHAWLKCRAKDKAGNLSVPLWLPLAK